MSHSTYADHTDPFNKSGPTSLREVFAATPLSIFFVAAREALQQHGKR